MEMTRMRYVLVCALGLASCLSTTAALAQNDSDSTVRAAEQVLAEIMAIPGKAIPEYLLAEAQGVVIVPNVIKIGFIAGVRRGHGVVMVRDAEGEWSLPQFVTLTGGSVGWQAGIQGTDVVLVFTTRKGVEGLMQGKFTIGADASASAGPVGRNAAASTDLTLRSEILSYSRSRGLFLGVAIDGSQLEIDNQAHAIYYGSQTSELPRLVPESAIKLRQFLVDISTPVAVVPGGAPGAVVAGAAVPGAVVAGAPAGALAPPPAVGPPGAVAVPASRVDATRRALAQSSRQLAGILKPEWQQYLALPKEVYEGGTPAVEQLTGIVGRYDRVAHGAGFQQLAERPEFQTTFDLLREYNQEIAVSAPRQLSLPPPPSAK
jgi:SH3 domain-containing YSC84-like protein 1